MTRANTFASALRSPQLEEWLTLSHLGDPMLVFWARLLELVASPLHRHFLPLQPYCGWTISKNQGDCELPPMLPSRLLSTFVAFRCQALEKAEGKGLAKSLYLEVQKVAERCSTGKFEASDEICESD